jgi:hypothetical protein
MSMHERSQRLSRMFSALVPALAAGCGPTDEFDDRDFTDDLCTETDYKMLEVTQPASPVDYLELREAIAHEGTENFDDPGVVDAFGALCSGANDRPACEAAFAALPLASDFVYYGFETIHTSLAFSRGDEVSALGSLDAVRSFLGPLDTVGDAALLATLEGHQLACDVADDAAEFEGGYILRTRSGSGCGDGDDVNEHVVLVHPDGTIEVLQTKLIERGDPGCAIGRLPAGGCVRFARGSRARPVGRFLAGVAQLERASVTAFAQLASELALHRAPAPMIRGALRSRDDEVRHARVTARLAHRYGVRPAAPRPAAWSPRPLVDVACDNAVEGCVRETYGALVAHLQARHARGPGMRRIFAGIARDETRHAALSWDLAAWAESRLSAHDRRRVARVRLQAQERLALELTQPEAEVVHAVTGIPHPDQARALFRGLCDALRRSPLA